MSSRNTRIAPLLITIDGPAGAGKTTVSRSLATRLGFLYVDTGALYRAVAFEAVSRGVDTEKDDELDRLASGLDLKFVHTDEGVRLLSDGSDISDAIRTPRITMIASAVSARPPVRRALLDAQKRMGAKKAAVFEGRDMGTVVFPDADVKFFLTAELAARARRRFDEYGDAKDQRFEDVLEDMRRRDENDSTRVLAPLRAASDAVIIDSTDMNPEAVVDAMAAHVYSKHG